MDKESLTPLQAALSHLSLNTQQSIAIIDNLYLEGAFEPEHLWKSIHCVGGKFGREDSTPPHDLFQHVHQVMCEAGAYTGQIDDFNPEYVLHHLFTDNNTATVQDAEDLLMYWSQSAFGRENDQERYELQTNENLRAHQEHYIQNAGIIGIIDALESGRKAYDETWVLSGDRQNMLYRMEFVKASIDNGVSLGKIRILTGERILSAEGSGLYNPDTEVLEGGEMYLRELAERNGVSSHEVTETMMAKDLSEQTFNGKKTEVTFEETAIDRDQWRINTPARVEPDRDRLRVNTLAQVEHEANLLAARLIMPNATKEPQQYHIQLVSNQPLVDRQMILTQRILNRILKNRGVTNVSVHIEGVGIEVTNDRTVEEIQSEIAALLYQHYYAATEGQRRKRSDALIMYRTRDNNPRDVPPFGVPASQQGVYEREIAKGGHLLPPPSGSIESVKVDNIAGSPTGSSTLLTKFSRNSSGIQR